MQVINLYGFLIFFFITQQVLALKQGDYIQIKDETPPIYGTIIDVKNDDITIRPHRFQGDFVKKSNEIEVIKTAQEISLLIPQDNQYSINLMWINAYYNSRYEHIFNTQETYDKILKSASSWHEKNPLAEVVVWYDSKMLLNTQKVPQWNGVIFKDVRAENFPEMQGNEDIFSQNTQIFFRVDLLRAVIAYNTLKAKNDNRYFFVYADMDVTTMNKDELFDASTIMDLDTYGIVMARGGAEGLENSFQIWANTQPKFLDAAKSIIIDRSIEQEKYVNKGNGLVSNPDMQQRVYANYFFMFPLYYASQDWCSMGINYSNNIERTSPNECEGTSENKLSNNKHIIKGRTYNIYYPSKIIDAPPSGFGGQPEIFEPNKLNLLNYFQKLKEGLENKNLDQFILKIALENNYKDVLEEIKKNLTKEELVKILMTSKNDVLNLITAINKNIYFIKDLIDDNLLKHLPDLLKNQSIVNRFTYLLERKFENSFDGFDSDTLEIMLKVFSSNDKLKNIFFEIFESFMKKQIESPESDDAIIDDLNLAGLHEIVQNLNLIKDENFMLKLAEILKMKNNENQNYFHRKILGAGTLDDFKNAPGGLNSWKSTFTNYPNLLNNILNEINTSNILNEINNSSKNLNKIRLEKLNAIKELQGDLNTLLK